MYPIISCINGNTDLSIDKKSTAEYQNTQPENSPPKDMKFGKVPCITNSVDKECDITREMLEDLADLSIHYKLKENWQDSKAPDLTPFVANMSAIKTKDSLK